MTKQFLVTGGRAFGRTAGLVGALLAAAGPLPSQEINQADFTLPFPEPTEAEKQKAGRMALADYAHQAAARVLIQAKAEARKARQTRKRLEAVVAGGWVVEFEPRRHFGLQTSTRGQRRRVQLGREKPSDQSAVEVFGGK